MGLLVNRFAMLFTESTDVGPAVAVSRWSPGKNALRRPITYKDLTFSDVLSLRASLVMDFDAHRLRGDARCVVAGISATNQAPASRMAVHSDCTAAGGCCRTLSVAVTAVRAF